jgi:hypothetical protein
MVGRRGALHGKVSGPGVATAIGLAALGVSACTSTPAPSAPSAAVAAWTSPPPTSPTISARIVRGIAVLAPADAGRAATPASLEQLSRERGQQGAGDGRQKAVRAALTPVLKARGGRTAPLLAAQTQAALNTPTQQRSGS